MPIARLGAACALASLLSATAAAQSAGDAGAAPEPPATVLPQIEVVGASPVLGSGVDRDKVPANVRTLSSDDLRRAGPADLVGTLERRIGGVSLNEVQGNPFQPDVQLRGFSASPVLGTPQGIAVYQNGIRINEVFGDTVNWDLIPDVAIDRLNLVSNNPVFGLNALGGALALEMKNGFTFQGFEADLHGGSFGRRAGSAEYGARFGNVGLYFAGEAANEDGWRDHSPSELRRLYGDLGLRGERLELHLNFSGASNRFGAVGPTPIELLDQRRASVWTGPQTYRNDLAMVSLEGSYQATDALSLQGNIYFRAFRQKVENGNTSEIAACDDAPGLLCLEDALLFSSAGTPIPDVLGGRVPGTNDRSATAANGYGGSLQATHAGRVLDRDNHLVVGASLDFGEVDFNASSELGVLGSDLFVNGTGFIISQPGGEVAPVRLHTTTRYYGFYVNDSFDVTSALTLTLGGRFNLAEVKLADRRGTSLNGSHEFSRFNPAAGVTYKLAPWLTAYAGYSESNRAPTPAELACADPARPCALEGFLVADPPLKQVVSHTYEAGLRGRTSFAQGDRLTWNLGFFRTENSDDIINVASPIVTSRGFFQNAGDTLRQGIEAGLAYRADGWSLRADYALVDATFESTLTLSSPLNPAAIGGLITVTPGDRLPSVPRHRLKLGADYDLTSSLTIGGDLVVASGQHLRGDESNQNSKLDGYAIANLHATYRLGEHAEIYALVQNLFDQRYETFGTFFDPTQVPFLRLSDPRTLTPGAPLGAFGGVRIRF